MNENPNMKQYIFSFLLLGTWSLVLSAQNYKTIDKRAIETPEAETTSVASLAAYLTAFARNDHEKARAFYVWITHHVSYSDTTVSNGWLGTPENARQQQPENVLRNRRAVCEGFANLFKALCVAGGLQAEVVTGIVKDEHGMVADVGHAWNAIQLNGDWYLTDPTWGAGYADYWSEYFVQEFDEAYFLIGAIQMIQSHLPDDPIWQLLPNPLTEAEFRKLTGDALTARRIQASTDLFMYRDSIEQWFQQDSVMRMLQASERILRYNPTNALALARLGSYYYNQALFTFFSAEEDILEALDNKSFRLDTTALLHRFFQAEKDLQKGWEYYHRIQDPKLQQKIAEMPAQRAIAAEFDYLRGMLLVWQITQLSEKFNQSGVQQADLEWMQAVGRRANEYLRLARSVYDDYTGDLYNAAVLKTLLHEALGYNYLARTDLFFYGRWNDLSEAELHANLAGLDRAAAQFEQMKQLVQSALNVDPNSIMAASFAGEYPRGMAMIESDRGAIHLAILEKKYARQWNEPQLINVKMAKIMISDYQTFEKYYHKSLAYLENCEPGEEVTEITQRLRLLKSSMHAYLGDIQLQYVTNLLKGIKTEEVFVSRRKEILHIYDKAIQQYESALALSAENEAIRAQLVKMLDNIRASREELAAYK